MNLYCAALLLTFVVGSLSRPSSEQSEGKRLVQFTENGPTHWLTSDGIDDLAAKDINFIDITDHQTVLSRAPSTKLLAIPTVIRFQPSVQAAIAKLSTHRMTEFLTAFSAYHNRYYTTATGVASSDWLTSQIQDSITSSGFTGIATVRQFTHTWAQKSVIARIEGTNSESKEIIILGAHMDSITSGAAGAAPGADDNGTGSTVILEAFRALLESGFIPKTTIEFQWYAAEEVGLRGSQDIAATYRAQKIEVAGMINFDMAGYSAAQSRINIITDFTNPELSAFLRKVVEAYNTYPWYNSSCGYACSDHASWHRDGVRAAHPHEGNTSPYLHTTRDTLQYVTFTHLLEFTKLAVGYAIEFAEPSSSL